MKNALLTLGGALVLLVVVLFLRERGYQSAVKSRYVFDTAQATTVERLDVRLQDDSVTLVKHDGRWKVLPDSFPADEARVTLALGYLLRLEDKEVVSASPDSTRWVQFGLNDGEAKRVEWSTRGKATRVQLGHTSSIDFNSTYWKRPEGPQVYRTPGNFTHEIGARARDWKDKTLFPAFETDDLGALGVRWRDESGRMIAYDLVRGADSAFRVTIPGSLDTLVIPAATGRRLFNQATRIGIDEIPESDDPSIRFAVSDSPSVVVIMTLRDGTIRTIDVGHEDDEHAYFAHPVHGRVVSVYASRLWPFKQTPVQLQAPVSGGVAPDEEWEDVSMPGGTR